MIPRSHRKEMWAEEWQKQNSLYSCLIPPKNLSHFNNLIWRDWGQRTTWFPQSHSFTWPCRLQSGSARLSSPAPTWLTDGCEPALTDHWRGKPSAPQERHKLQVTATGGSETSAGCSDRREIYLSVCRSVWDCHWNDMKEMYLYKKKHASFQEPRLNSPPRHKWNSPWTDRNIFDVEFWGLRWKYFFFLHSFNHLYNSYPRMHGLFIISYMFYSILWVIWLQTVLTFRPLSLRRHDLYIHTYIYIYKIKIN